MNNIEEIFKASLENNEMPFDPKAWEAMSSRLDRAMPSSSAKKFPKWGWAASLLIIVGISALYFTGSDNNTSKTDKKSQATLTTAPAEPKVVNSNENNTEIATGTASQAPKANTTKEAVSQESWSEGHESFFPPVLMTPTPPIKEVITGCDLGGGYVASASISLPKVNDSYCESEKITISNANKTAIQLVTENGNVYSIPGRQVLSIELTLAGEYFFVYQEAGKSVRNHAFNVLQKPRTDFYANDQTLYDEGLPYNKLEANTGAASYLWTNDKGDILSKEKECSAHLYTKGKHLITLTTEGINGCKNEVTKPVSCEVTYNLLAMTGFDPSSSDIRNSTFIPYALLERKIPFEMQIIDPKDGHIVYETKDANQPWTGIDKKTNQMIPDYSTYVWKVTIMEKAVGEPNRTYQGLITRFSKNY